MRKNHGLQITALKSRLSTTLKSVDWEKNGALMEDASLQHRLSGNLQNEFNRTIRFLGSASGRFLVKHWSCFPSQSQGLPRLQEKEVDASSTSENGTVHSIRMRDGAKERPRSHTRDCTRCSERRSRPPRFDNPTSYVQRSLLIAHFSYAREPSTIKLTRLNRRSKKLPTSL